jgi:hypothetical protein
LLEFANSGVNALYDPGGLKLAYEFRNHGIAQLPCVHGLRKNLQCEHIVVLIDDQAREKVSLAEHNAERIAVADDLLAIINGRGDPPGN